TKDIELVISPVVYRTDPPLKITVKAGQNSTQHWDLNDTGQWYDFAVTCTQESKFYRRFAGRVETGQDSVSDPAMV
ncbi:MAG: DUF756 domain-containing protein, partial [Acinetobacter sp.]|nr:DUF756 domain-containing protein [Acinetobacter sp.]